MVGHSLGSYVCGSFFTSEEMRLLERVGICTGMTFVSVTAIALNNRAESNGNVSAYSSSNLISCKSCGYIGGKIGSHCPRCNSVYIEKIDRTTRMISCTRCGYLGAKSGRRCPRCGWELITEIDNRRG